MALVFRVFPCSQSCFKAIISNVLKIKKALFVSSLVQIIIIIPLGTQSSSVFVLHTVTLNLCSLLYMNTKRQHCHLTSFQVTLAMTLTPKLLFLLQ